MKPNHPAIAAVLLIATLAGPATADTLTDGPVADAQSAPNDALQAAYTLLNDHSDLFNHVRINWGSNIIPVTYTVTNVLYGYIGPVKLTTLGATATVTTVWTKDQTPCDSYQGLIECTPSGLVPPQALYTGTVDQLAQGLCLKMAGIEVRMGDYGEPDYVIPMPVIHDCQSPWDNGE